MQMLRRVIKFPFARSLHNGGYRSNYWETDQLPKAQMGWMRRSSTSSHALYVRPGELISFPIIPTKRAHIGWMMRGATAPHATHVHQTSGLRGGSSTVGVFWQSWRSWRQCHCLHNHQPPQPRKPLRLTHPLYELRPPPVVVRIRAVRPTTTSSGGAGRSHSGSVRRSGSRACCGGCW